MSGFLGGINLGTPAERNKETFMRELSSRAWQNEQARRFPASQGYLYPGGGPELLLRHGQFYPGRELPDQYKHLRGVQSECFHNALVVSEAMPALQYCEGYCYTGQGYAFNHAWCIAPDGGVLEVTAPTEWDEIRHYRNEELVPLMPAHTWAYFGVIVATLFMRAVWDYPDDTWDVPLFERHTQERARSSLSPAEMGEPESFPYLKIPYDPRRTQLP